MTTLRSIHKATRERHAKTWREGWDDAARTWDREYCRHCRHTAPCPDYEGAVAALKILDNAERRSRGTRDKRQSTDIIYVYDPGRVVPPAATDALGYPGCPSQETPT